MPNNNIAAIPQIWAREAAAVLNETSVMAGLVNFDYSPMLASYGDTVNIHRPARRLVRRKAGDADYATTDVTLESIPVKLDQIIFDSFLVRDHEFSLSIADLTRRHLVPSAQAVARGVDRALTGRMVDTLIKQGTPAKRAGKLGGVTKTNSPDFILEANEILHLNNAPSGLRQAVVHPTMQTFLQANDLFARADSRGSNEQIVTGRVGQIYNTFVNMSQNVPYCNKTLADIQATTLNGAKVPGNTSVTIVDPGTDPVVGEYLVLEENGQPTYIVTATTPGTVYVLNEGLKYAATNGSAVTHYLKCVNEATTRAAGYQDAMTFTHTSGKNLQVGQILSFGTVSRHTYTIIEVQATTATTTTVLLSRPLDASVASGADAFPGPGGAYNSVFDRDAVTVVNRPMALPEGQGGALTAVQVLNGISIRIAMQYVIAKGAWQVNLDTLLGVAPLDANLGVLLLS